VLTPGIHTAVTGGMTDWQITLTAAGTAPAHCHAGGPPRPGTGTQRHIPAPGT
jgi:hypothetical protein